MVKVILKTNLNHIIITLGLIGNNILRVNAQQQNDCAIYQEAVRYLGENNINFATDNCCSNRDVVTCENNSITKIKLNRIKCNNIEQSNIEWVIKKLSSLPNLTSLEISYGQRCEENMPKNISELKKLKYLKMIHNGYQSELPESISTMTNLEELDLSENRLVGTIPNSYGNLKNLKMLRLNYNNIEGYIPYSFSNLENLRELNLKNTKLKGYIPKFPRIETCDFERTNLCILSSTDCTNNLKKLCTKGDVKETNRSNGNPDPNSIEYEGDVKETNRSNGNPDSNSTEYEGDVKETNRSNGIVKSFTNFLKDHPFFDVLYHMFLALLCFICIVASLGLCMFLLLDFDGCKNTLKEKFKKFKTKQYKNKKNKNDDESTLPIRKVNESVQEEEIEEIEVIVNKKQKRPHKDRIITKVRK